MSAGSCVCRHPCGGSRLPRGELLQARPGTHRIAHTGAQCSGYTPVQKPQARGQSHTTTATQQATESHGKTYRVAWGPRNDSSRRMHGHAGNSHRTTTTAETATQPQPLRTMAPQESATEPQPHDHKHPATIIGNHSHLDIPGVQPATRVAQAHVHTQRTSQTRVHIQPRAGPHSEWGPQGQLSRLTATGNISLGSLGH